ncbi:sensor diguanylate cyclase/phosphodiesterase, CHASE4 and PAS domain-containing [Syntrophotalea carbinolica DSM 2380]|uniref:Sensor diguanylate cyclase/phosphodiesterase, CHASE4 and PAS domain-containing n=1 Tax=Syntrophotalea carbinolica (strain DSM 2380 / NBRC 103641 / GraBd1) TaxID=338963 RepID=Q3A254_SYNC1|nr:EAL domain-containing protein [Syntrophotalea carbinolica]ABA89553.1 sensor diguanylate cyclase/phosphodiesterase, CHASE4 and PAS domain-containing [Syntrophotalea carbinolica DSM 2380]
MKWSWKRFLGMGLVILFLNGTLLMLNRGVFLKSFTRLENDRAYETLHRVVGVYQENLAFLERMTKDWANWDDAYAFMQTRDPSFITSNVVDSTFSTLNVNVILFLDEQGLPVAGKAYDLIRHGAVPMYVGLQDHFTTESFATLVEHQRRGVTGLLRLPQGLLMLSWQPILTGEGQGPSRGALLMGRLLDSRELDRLGAKAEQSLEFGRLHSGPSWPSWSEQSTAAPEILLRVVDATRIRARVLFRDIFGVPAAVIGTNLSRDIYAQGLQSIIYFHIWLLVVSLMAGVCILVIWDRLAGSRQRQRDSEHLFQHLFQFSADAFFLCEEQGRFVDVNHQSCAVLGFDRQKLLSLSWSDITDAAIGNLLSRTQRLSTAAPVPMEATFTGNRGRTFVGDVSVTHLEIQDQVLFFVLVRDITERKAADTMLRKQKARLNYLAYHDVLTGLPNRLKAIELLQTYIGRANQRDTMVAVLIFDLDRFKNLNESLGHETGDEILMEVARRIQEMLRDTDVVARFGGDEFLVLLEHVADSTGVKHVAEKLLEAIAQPLRIGEQQFYLTGSIGISLYPKHGENAQTILKAADSAMYFAKEQGRNTYRFFIPSINVEVEERLYLETDLRQALNLEQFMLFYQPEFNLHTGKVECLETLLRWQHPKRGIVGPGEFIPLAEDTGLIVPIGEWVLQEACRQVIAWREQGLPSIRVAVNISARQFRQSGFIEMVFRVLKQYGLAAEWLELEITESFVIQSAEHALNMFKVLRQSGISLAVDDFGQGYSSLSYLRKFPFTKLKMDRAFVKNVVNDPHDEAIAAAIIAMGDSLGQEVVAEGIETREQLDTLRTLGCPCGQGYYLALPMEGPKMAEFLQRVTGDSPAVLRAFRK